MGSVQYDFGDETVVVTGGSSGIGRAVARRFGAGGATVVVADVREEPKESGADPTHEVIRRDGGVATFVETDVSDPDALAAVVEAAREFGGVDIMVNNAGIFRGTTLVDTLPETFDAVYGVNARGVFAGMQAAARDMLDRGVSGSIVNTASISSEFAQTGHAVYDASKAAVMMLTRVAALELAQRGIRVNAVAPGPVSTHIGDANETSGDFDPPTVEKRPPMGRSSTPEEIAGNYLYLASEEASYVTGHLLYVDGGYAIL